MTQSLYSLLSPRGKAEYLKIKADKLKAIAAVRQFTPYQFEPQKYIAEKLKWEPWQGESDDRPGQTQVLDAYRLALLQLHEKQDYENGRLGLEELQYWQPGQVIQNYISVDAGHTVGKTRIGAGMVNHFFDCFPSIIYSYAPSREQVHDLLWKEIKSQRRGKGLPGRIMDLRLEISDDRFAKGVATNNAKDAGTERAQGQHGPYLMFVLDEAEGIPGFIWDAVEAMSGGGIVIVLILRNPRTRTSRAHKIRQRPFCKTFRVSCLWFPNVIHNRDIVPGGCSRDYVEKLLDDNEEKCEIVTEHNPDHHTLEVPWRPGIIYKPSIKFLWRVEGIAAAMQSDNTFCPIGRYEQAVNRDPVSTNPTFARIGVDAARWGNDYWTIYVNHNGRVWREAALQNPTNIDIFELVSKTAVRLSRQEGVTDLSIRVDGTGGYGAGVIDLCRASIDLKKEFDSVTVHEINFEELSYDQTMFADRVTEMYYHMGEAMQSLSVIDPPDELERDVCERTYHWVVKNVTVDQRNGRKVKQLKEVKEIESKADFKRRNNGDSPDNGDGAGLCCLPEFALTERVTEQIRIVYNQKRIGRR